MKRLAALLAVFALLLSACSGQEPERSADDYTLYYTAPLSESGGGDAIRSGVVRIEDSASLTTEELAAKLIDELLRPEGETARSPFPAGQACNSWRWRRDGPGSTFRDSTPGFRGSTFLWLTPA